MLGNRFLIAALFYILGCVGLTQGKLPNLTGARGIIKLPPGYQYRDPETLASSEAVARFARGFQKEGDRIAESNRALTEGKIQTTKFLSRLPAVSGRELEDNEIFDFVDSRFVDPLPETRVNKLLEEVEIERATPSTRLLPDELPPHFSGPSPPGLGAPPPLHFSRPSPPGLGAPPPLHFSGPSPPGVGAQPPPHFSGPSSPVLGAQHPTVHSLPLTRPKQLFGHPLPGPSPFPAFRSGKSEHLLPAEHEVHSLQALGSFSGPIQSQPNQFFKAPVSRFEHSFPGDVFSAPVAGVSPAPPAFISAHPVSSVSSGASFSFSHSAGTSGRNFFNLNNKPVF